MPVDAEAQRHAVLSGTPVCLECQLVSTEVFRFSGRDHAVAAMASTARDSHGRFWVTTIGYPLARVFSADGVLVGEVGGEGRGPGEFLQAEALIPVGDSMLVSDANNARMTVVGPDLRPTRSFRFAGQVMSGVSMGWPQIAVNAAVPTTEGVGHPFHVIDARTGEVNVSFGGSGSFSRRERYKMIGQVAWDPGSESLWTVGRHEFVLRQWTAGGELMSTLMADDELFPNPGQGQMGNHDTAPEPRVGDLVVAGDRALLLFYTPRSDWREAWRGVPDDQPHLRLDVLPAPSLLWAAHVAAVDLREGALIGKWDTALYSVGFDGPTDAVMVELPRNSFFRSFAVHELGVSSR